MSVQSEISRISNEVSSQTDLILQIQQALSDKAAGSGGGIDTSDGTISAPDVLSGKVGYAGGVRIVGTMPDNGAVNASIDGTGMTEYTIPKGYHNGSGKVSFAGTIETWSFSMESGSIVTKRVVVS